MLSMQPVDVGLKSIAAVFAIAHPLTGELERMLQILHPGSSRLTSARSSRSDSSRSITPV